MPGPESSGVLRAPRAAVKGAVHVKKGVVLGGPAAFVELQPVCVRRVVAEDRGVQHDAVKVGGVKFFSCRTQTGCDFLPALADAGNLVLTSTRDSMSLLCWKGVVLSLWMLSCVV